MSDRSVYPFEGKEARITWDKRLCIHAEECVRADNDLFKKDRKPWTDPDAEDVATIDDVVRRCPSGALAYTNADRDNPESAPDENSVMVVYNGPLYVSGELDVAGAADDMPGVKFRAALCRCGLSKNKPFCDNSHVGEFEDAGAVGKKGSEVESLGGELKVTPSRNGPLLLQGNFKIIAGTGKTRFTGTKAALCRCGHSGNKPFCDGSHRDAGFEADGA